MLKRLQKLDRKLESFINLMDRSLQDPINRVTTFEVFRQNGAHNSHAVVQQDITKVEKDTPPACQSASPIKFLRLKNNGMCSPFVPVDWEKGDSHVGEVGER